KAEAALVEVWQAVEQFLDESEAVRQPVQRLFARLGRPPFGLKEGVLPVLLAAALLHYDAEVALYEDGTFVPRLSPPIVERILRAPVKFEVQRCRMSGPRGVIFRKYAAVLQPGGDPKSGRSPRLLDLVRPLARAIKDLPDYVTKTKRLR